MHPSPVHTIPSKGTGPCVVFDPELIRRYGGPAPRYTSYPTALQFDERFGEPELRAAAAAAERGRPLSAYVHIPFCASPCFFCGCTRVITRQWDIAEAYLQHLHREIAMNSELFPEAAGIAQLHFGGGTPTYLKLEQIAHIIGALDAGFGLLDDESREYSIEIDPRTVSAETIQGLAGLGFNRLSLGVQDFDPAVQVAVNRVQTVKDTFDIIDAARRSGFRSVSVDLIYGLPLQTPASFRHTLEQVLAVRPDRVAAYSYAHLPHQFPGQKQIRLEDLPSAEVRLELLGETIETMTRHGYVYVGMDHFALLDDELVLAQKSGRLQRNFQGYSTFGGCDLVGFGMSAISRIGDSYSQNAKTLQSYERKLDGGHLPVQRGVQLDDDDRLRRDVIERIMCHGLVDTREIGRVHGIGFADYFAPELRRLQEFEDDGLVQLHETAIEVTPAGRLLLRSVASVFDHYLPAAPVTSARHTRVV